MYAIEGAPFMSSFNNQTPWVQMAQEMIAEPIMGKENLKFVDEYKTEGAVSGEFEHAKPKIEQDETTSDTHDILSYSRSEYNFRTNPKIDAADYYMSTDIGAKLKSREAIYKYFNMTFDVKELTCKDINEKAMAHVLKNWKGDKAVLDRFAKVGQ